MKVTFSAPGAAKTGAALVVSNSADGHAYDSKVVESRRKGGEVSREIRGFFSAPMSNQAFGCLYGAAVMRMFSIMRWQRRKLRRRCAVAARPS